MSVVLFQLREALHSVNSIAKWDGTSWSSLNGGIVGNRLRTTSLTTSLDGTMLFVGGVFDTSTANFNYSAKWDGASWSGIGVLNTSDLDGNPTALMTAADGTIYAGGAFINAGATELDNVAKWDSASNLWVPLGTGPGLKSNLGCAVSALASLGTNIYAAGSIILNPNNYYDAAQWSGSASSAWVGYAPQNPTTLNNSNAIAVTADGKVYNAIQSGTFLESSLNGAAWSSISGLNNSAFSLIIAPSLVLTP